MQLDKVLSSNTAIQQQYAKVSSHLPANIHHLYVYKRIETIVNRIEGAVVIYADVNFQLSNEVLNKVRIDINANHMNEQGKKVAIYSKK